jgi:hypothetical protein
MGLLERLAIPWGVRHSDAQVDATGGDITFNSWEANPSGDDETYVDMDEARFVEIWADALCKVELGTDATTGQGQILATGTGSRRVPANVPTIFALPQGGRPVVKCNGANVALTWIR